MLTSQRPKRILRDGLFLGAGVFSAAMGLKGFLLSSQFIDGGVTGISMLISSLFKVPLPWLLLFFNLPFIGLGYRQFGRGFAIKSALAITLLAISLAVIPFPDVTSDRLLTATFGGFFIGAGIGLAIRGGAVLDGTEIAALLISRNVRMLKVSDVILVLNVVIFGAAAFFLSIDRALYSMITYFAASKTIDFILHGIEEYTAVLIVSAKHQQLRKQIIEYGWGVTVIHSMRGYGKKGDNNDTTDILYVVLTRLELSRLRNLIDQSDPQAFVIQHSVDDVAGGKVRSLPMH